MRREQFADLISRRWAEAQRETCALPDLPWSFGDYPHFRTKRGYGVTFHEKDGRCRMMYAGKILRAPPGRADGVVRHELGHVVDILLPKKELNKWAASRGVKLASTDERRADDIARCIWGEPIYYDRKLWVQNTRAGVHPRPRHLGL